MVSKCLLRTCRASEKLVKGASMMTPEGGLPMADSSAASFNATPEPRDCSAAGRQGGRAGRQAGQASM